MIWRGSFLSALSHEYHAPLELLRGCSFCWKNREVIQSSFIVVMSQVALNTFLGTGCLRGLCFLSELKPWPKEGFWNADMVLFNLGVSYMWTFIWCKCVELFNSVCLLFCVDFILKKFKKILKPNVYYKIKAVAVIENSKRWEPQLSYNLDLVGAGKAWSFKHP